MSGTNFFAPTTLILHKLMVNVARELTLLCPRTDTTSTSIPILKASSFLSLLGLAGLGCRGPSVACLI